MFPVSSSLAPPAHLGIKENNATRQEGNHPLTQQKYMEEVLKQLGLLEIESKAAEAIAMQYMQYKYMNLWITVAISLALIVIFAFAVWKLTRNP